MEDYNKMQESVKLAYAYSCFQVLAFSSHDFIKIRVSLLSFLFPTPRLPLLTTHRLHHPQTCIWKTRTAILPHQQLCLPPTPSSAVNHRQHSNCRSMPMKPG